MITILYCEIRNKKQYRYSARYEKKVLELVRILIYSSDFLARHRESEHDFTRIRKLCFCNLLILIVTKSVKSIQLRLNEFFLDMNLKSTITNSAFTQARKKLKHTAFIELNDAITDLFYSDANRDVYRFLGVDGSCFRLPETSEIKEVYGSIKVSNNSVTESYCEGLFTCVFDISEQWAICADLYNKSVGERKAFLSLFNRSKEKFTSKDVFIFDRGYASYEILASLAAEGIHCIVRLQSNSFKDSQALFDKSCDQTDITVIIKKPIKSIGDTETLNEIKIRFVRVLLNTGEVEVLATSLFDIPAERFKELYFLRWGIETFFDLLKNRLCIENFSGTSKEAVLQDIFATIFLSNIERVVIHDTNQDIQSKQTKYTQQVNTNVSFNAIKHEAFNLLTCAMPIDDVMIKLEKLFTTAVSIKRPERKNKRRLTPRRKVIKHLKYRKKYAF